MVSAEALTTFTGQEKATSGGQGEASSSATQKATSGSPAASSILHAGVGEASSPAASRRNAGAQYGRGHNLYRSGVMLWCRTCGAYAEKRLKALKEPCQGAAGKGPRAGQLARLVNGLHPLRPREEMPPPVRVTGRG